MSDPTPAHTDSSPDPDSRAETGRFRELDRLFQAVCDLPVAQRAARLLELAPEDDRLRLEVLELLDAEARADAARGLDPLAMAEQLSQVLEPAEPGPQEVAGFRLLSRLGAGGMGVVYEAEQASPRRLVALKLLRPGLVTPGLVRRFEVESESLGRLRHPGIATIYHAGLADTTAGPRPYFAMELVRGQPLDRWGVSVTPRERLGMLARIADAVHHAHTQGVIHRDLKPANILVTPEGDPKILDFGVARLADDPLRARPDSVGTRHGELVGTVTCMSPEQLSGDPTLVDARSDVYALGVLLFELIAGRPPHEVAGMPILDAARIVREQPALRLSSLQPRFRGDVETIAQAALEPDKERRYASAAAMADDLRRHLTGQTIAARPPSAVYQLSRLARRHLPATLAFAVALASLVAGFIGVALALRETTAQRQVALDQAEEARRQTRLATAVNDFFRDQVLAAADPWTDPDPEVSVTEALQRAVDGLKDQFNDEPAIEAAIRASVGRIFSNLARYEPAEAQLRRAIELFDDAAPGSVQAAEARGTLGFMLAETGEYDASLALLEQAVADLERALGPVAFETQDHSNSLVLTLTDMDQIDRARTISDRLVASVDAGTIATESIAVTALANAGIVEYKGGNIEAAVPYYDRALALAERVHGPEHPETLAITASLALINQRLGRHQESMALYERAVAGNIAALGPEHPHTLTARNNLAILFSAMGEAERATELFDEILGIRLRILGETHPDTMVSLMMSARHLGSIDRFEEAEQRGLRGATLLLEHLGPDHAYTGVARRIMVTIYDRWGKPELAERWREPIAAPEARPAEP